MKTVAILCLPHVVPFDLSVPLEIFGRAKTNAGTNGYCVLVCGPKKVVSTSFFEIRIKHGLETLAKADTIIVPGLSDPSLTISIDVLTTLREAASRGATIASICSGSFILAHAGLLNGLRATTHWLAAGALAKEFPLIDVDPHVLYVDNGKILTSAGASSGLDLCLHLVRRDYGSKSAAVAARLSVVPLERSGGQSQFIVHETPGTQGSLENVLVWMQRKYDEPLTVTEIANKAKMSERSLIRKFKEQTGTSPLQWLLRMRIAKAKELLEASAQPIDLVSEKVGFGCAVSFREHFKRQVGVTPKNYRAAFKSAPVR